MGKILMFIAPYCMSISNLYIFILWLGEGWETFTLQNFEQLNPTTLALYY